MSTAVKKLLFGTAGIPHATPTDSSLAALDQIMRLKLDGMEIEFVKGAKMGTDTAQAIRDKAARLGIALSVHAPYFINLNSADQGKRLMSRERLLNSARLARACGARSLVFHAGYYGQDPAEKALETIKAELKEILSILRAEKSAVVLRIETMGKRSQFGSFDEVLSLCRALEGLQPCLDFSHIYAREGKVNSYDGFRRILSKVRKKLGEKALHDVHIHISGADFNDKGEIRHINLADSDFRAEDWIRALREFGTRGLVICESPNLEEDALWLKDLYRSQEFKHA
jgi:deoxyribonuclease-4